MFCKIIHQKIFHQNQSKQYNLIFISLLFCCRCRRRSPLLVFSVWPESSAPCPDQWGKKKKTIITAVTEILGETLSVCVLSTKKEKKKKSLEFSWQIHARTKHHTFTKCDQYNSNNSNSNRIKDKIKQQQIYTTIELWLNVVC